MSDEIEEAERAEQAARLRYEAAKAAKTPEAENLRAEIANISNPADLIRLIEAPHTGETAQRLVDIFEAEDEYAAARDRLARLRANGEGE